jgi:hypothetical protein
MMSFCNLIVNGEGKSFGKQAVISEMEGMNTGIQMERLYV